MKSARSSAPCSRISAAVAVWTLAAIRLGVELAAERRGADDLDDLGRALPVARARRRRCRGSWPSTGFCWSHRWPAASTYRMSPPRVRGILAARRLRPRTGAETQEDFPVRLSGAAARAGATGRPRRASRSRAGNRTRCYRFGCGSRRGGGRARDATATATASPSTRTAMPIVISVRCMASASPASGNTANCRCSKMGKSCE